MTRNPTPRVSTQYGAPLGRPTRRRGDPEAAPLSLRRVRLDGGGYDAGGAYWGHGAPLYWCGDDAGEIDVFLRARSREDAKTQLREDLGDDIRFKR